MAKRLQVILQDPEYREIQRAADAQRLSIAAWVRQALAAARHREPVGNVGKKLDSVRAAARHSFPTAPHPHKVKPDVRGLELRQAAAAVADRPLQERLEKADRHAH